MQRKPLGRNQLIGIVGFAAPLLLTFGLCAALAWTRDVDAALSQWMSFCSSYVPVAIGVILGGSAIVKGADALAARRSPDVEGPTP